MAKLLSICGYVLMVAGLLGMIATRNLISTNLLSILLQAGAVALMIWARVTFGRRSFHLAANPTDGGLVTTGPYRYIRHPIYAAVCLFVAAGAGVYLSASAFGCATVVLAGALLRIFSEEQLLRQRYPGYQDYAARTWRLLPYVF